MYYNMFTTYYSKKLDQPSLIQMYDYFNILYYFINLHLIVNYY